MTRVRKSWAQKLAQGRPHQVKRLHVDMAGMKAGQIMLVPSPQIIDAFIRALPAGRSLSAAVLRAQLAEAYGAEVCCPITTGILLRVVAEAALEAQEHGAPDVTPFWRVVDPGSALAGKLSCGRDRLTDLRRREGLG